MKISKTFFLFMALLSACSSFDSTVVATNTPEDSLRNIPQITDINRYSEVLDSFEKSPLVDHFPKIIHPEATHVRFAYQPRIMQGAMFLELLMTFPVDQINELWDKYSSFEKYQFTEDKTINDIPKPILYLFSDKNNEVDQNFSIFLINAEPAGEEDFIWNHGTMYGVGINKTTSQVIYWSEYW